MHYFLIAGEASGDLHGSHLIKALRKIDTDAQFTFLGGDLMKDAAQIEPLIHIRQMAYMGFSEVLRNLTKISGNMRKTKKALVEAKPDAVILIDYPSFNLKIARKAHKLGIPVYYYISPKIWAWKSWRLGDIKRYVKKVFSILPFETKYYASRNAEAIYVGNPSVNEVDALLKNLSSREEFLKKYRLRDKKIIALMPGSRIGEIRNNLPIMAAAERSFPQCRGVIIGAQGISDETYALYGAGAIPIIRPEHATEVLAHSTAALVTSGTATLEAALVGTPQVALYRGNGSELTYKIMNRILKIKFVTLPNLIADQQIIPELLLHKCTAEAATEALIPLLSTANPSDPDSTDSPERAAQLEGYATMRQILGTSDAPTNTARMIFEDLSGAV